MDKIFKVDLERSRVYWDYYKMVYHALSLCMAAGMISAAVIYTRGEIGLNVAGGIILFLFLCVIFLSAIMNLIIWRHENRHFDEIIRQEEKGIGERPPGVPLV
ncbi:MAG: hypothetical protein V1875_01135 [Candidatus Altiarchaeota archaeon]